MNTSTNIAPTPEHLAKRIDALRFATRQRRRFIPAGALCQGMKVRTMVIHPDYGYSTPMELVFVEETSPGRVYGEVSYYGDGIADANFSVNEGDMLLVVDD